MAGNITGLISRDFTVFREDEPSSAVMAHVHAESSCGKLSVDSVEAVDAEEGEKNDGSKKQQQQQQQQQQKKKRPKLSPEHPYTPDQLRESPVHGAVATPAAVAAASENGCLYDPSILISPIGRDLSINCLLQLSRSYYNDLELINKSFRGLVRSGELFKLRQMSGIVEHWIYFSCDVLKWDAYDPFRGRWISIPMMPSIECFTNADKESLAVGMELLVFGMEVGTNVVLKYSILTNNWERGPVMNTARFLFASASFGERAIVAGGTDYSGSVLDSSEVYDSASKTWSLLPRMNQARKMCSGVFMDGKFYVLGGVGRDAEVLNCGEEYDPERGSWRLITDMSLDLNQKSGAPPLVAVVKNELYAVDYANNDLKRYAKEKNSWIVLGKVPERYASVKGWGLAFRACGERLIVLGGMRAASGGTIEVNSWVPDDGPPEWNVIASRRSGSFVYNCAVMGC